MALRIPAARDSGPFSRAGTPSASIRQGGPIIMKPAVVRPIAALWEWQLSAACRGLESARFFSPSGERGRARVERERSAREICGGCVVREECARFAAESGEQHGVWGGVTGRERATQRQRSRTASTPVTTGMPS
jgi:WhiB family transcriptional regulator, redox-sensing transcriptional regulator